MQKLTPWILHDGCLLRHVVGQDVDDIRHRVALVEKSPRVRIRPAYLGERSGTYEDGEPYTERQWPEHLDWCYGYKGDGPEDEESKLWCDNMLRALGYQL